MNKRQLISQFPEIKDMADQVSEGRAIFVSKFFINGEWKNSGFLPTTDLDRFYKSVLNLKGRLADGISIRICIAADKPSSKVREVEVWFNNPEEKEQGLGNVLSAELKSGLEELRKEINETKGESSAMGNIEIKLLQMEHKTQMDAAALKHKFELEKRDTRIEELTAEVAELEEEMENAEKLMKTANAQLNGLDEERESKNVKMIDMLGSVAAKGLETFVMNNPAVLTKGFGVPEETVKEIFAASKVNKINTSAEEQVPDPTDEYAGVPEKHKTCIETLKNCVKGLDAASFNSFWNFILLTFDADGKFHADKAEEILKLKTENA